MQEKTKLKFHRLFWFGLFILCALIIVICRLNNYVPAEWWGYPVFLVGIFAFFVFLFSLFLSYKEYYSNGKMISVYAGWCHHTLRINGEKYDEHTTFSSWTPIYLSTTLEDGTIVEAVISTSKRIMIKVNDKLLYKKSK